MQKLCVNYIVFKKMDLIKYIESLSILLCHKFKNHTAYNIQITAKSSVVTFQIFKKIFEYLDFTKLTAFERKIFYFNSLLKAKYLHFSIIDLLI